MAPRLDGETAALFDPHDVVAVCVTGGADPLSLHPEEFALIAAAAPARQREFAAGRCAARFALRELGIDAPPITRTTRRSPVWPPGVFGTIAHTADIAIAVVSAGPELGIGIDIERVGRVNQRVESRVCTAGEQEQLDALPRAERSVLATKIFGGKEAFYKAQYQLTGSYVGFTDVTTIPDRHDLVIAAASEHVALAELELPATIRFLRQGDLLISAATVSRLAEEPTGTTSW